MEPDETQQNESPRDESPPAYSRAEPHYFGLTPHALVAVLAAVSLVTGIVLLATGPLAAGVLLLVAALFLGALFTEQARRRRDSRFSRAAASTVDNSLAFAGFARASAVAWTRAGRRAAQLRLQARKLSHERSRMQADLGAAAYNEDEGRMTELRARMHELDERLEECVREAHAAITQAQTRTSNEHRAVASTEIRRAS